MLKKKSKKIPKCQFLVASSIIFCLFFMSSAYAATYDLQNYSTCVNGQCTLTVNLSNFGFNTAKINNMKSVNITNFLTKSGIINNFQYSWSGTVLTLTGSVNSNVYWSFTAGGDTYDPWWNITDSGISVFVAPDTSYSDTGAIKGGVQQAVNVTGRLLLNFTKDALSDATNLEVYNDDETLINSTTFSGVIAALYINAIPDNYRYVASKGGSAWTIRYKNSASGSFPIASKYGNFTSGTTRTSGTWATDGYSRTFLNVTETLTTSNYYTANLYLNSNESNISISNSTVLNITAITNMTGLNVSLYKNSTLINSSLTSCTNISNISVGYYNITAWIGNASTNTTITYFVNVTYTPQTATTNGTFTYNFDLNDAPLTCMNASFVQRNATVDNSFHQEVYPCPNGCDAATGNCTPKRYEITLMQLAIIVITVILTGLFFVWSLKPARTPEMKLIKIIFTTSLMFSVYYLLFLNIDNSATVFPAWFLNNPITLIFGILIMTLLFLAFIILLFN